MNGLPPSSLRARWEDWGRVDAGWLAEVAASSFLLTDFQAQLHPWQSDLTTGISRPLDLNSRATWSSSPSSSWRAIDSLLAGLDGLLLPSSLLFCFPASFPEIPLSCWFCFLIFYSFFLKVEYEPFLQCDVKEDQIEWDVKFCFSHELQAISSAVSSFLPPHHPSSRFVQKHWISGFELVFKSQELLLFFIVVGKASS